MVNSPEARTRLVQSFYAAYLHRTADPGGLSRLGRRLAQAASREQVIAGFVGSVEYRNRLQPPPPADTQPPVVVLDGPPAGSTTDHNPTVTGRATDDRSGLAALEAGVDDGPFARSPSMTPAASGSRRPCPWTAPPTARTRRGCGRRTGPATGRAPPYRSCSIRELPMTPVWTRCSAEPGRARGRGARCHGRAVAARNLALVHLAVLDAVNAVEGAPAYLVALPAAPGSSAEAAVAAAAHRVLSYLYPAQQASLDADLAPPWPWRPTARPRPTASPWASRWPTPSSPCAARTAATRSWITCRRDGPGAGSRRRPCSTSPWPRSGPTLQPFAMTSPDQFRPAGPPA